MSIYDNLNPVQQEAVYSTEGPLLILAGAGSGKTRVLTHRIAYLIEEKGVNPWNIMAITFTNKAASEMRERVDKIVGEGSQSVWVSTFHSSCVRILRRYIERIGYSRNFTIYDSDDQKSVMKDICKRLNIDTKMYKEKTIINAISSAKNELIDPLEYQMQVMGDFYRKTIARAYVEYQNVLKKSNALDFDDLIGLTVELFKSCPDVLENYQERLKYIMVDEYQDTNTAQFEFIRLLASRYHNLCVVGDDDQSIYKFRGANIGNILGFEKVFEEAKVIKLEQNYRSTKNILEAANHVIANNSARKAKKLWTDNEDGSCVHFQQFMNAYEEAEFVSGDITKRVRLGSEYKECAILYRTNAQSRLFEEKFVQGNIPYKIVGGINFYARKEIKDLLAYLKTVDNGQDDLAVRRIINVPRRGIGITTITKISAYAEEMEISFYDACKVANEIPGLGRSAVKIKPFVNLIQMLRSKASIIPVKDLMEEIIEHTGYVEELEVENTEESRDRISNIDELLSKIVSYQEEEKQNSSLSGFLENVALVADIDSVDAGDNRVLLMTLHSAKGLEFPYVYLTGMEEGIFPSYMTICSDDKSDMEEERRLCYVGITRAMKELTLTAANQRMIHGQTQFNRVSRFLKEIPQEFLQNERRLTEPKSIEIPKNDNYKQIKTSFQTKAFDPAQYKVKKADNLDYEVGDIVRHIKFGQGVVTSITDGGRDFEVTVDFERYGKKKMFAGFAKLKKY